VEEKKYGERKKEYGTGKINKETLGNVEEKRYGPGLVWIRGSIAVSWPSHFTRIQ
jgi:hypothetical protein